MQNKLPSLVVFGCGSMGQNHLRLLANSRICDLVALIEPDKKLRLALEKAYRIPGFTSEKEALKSIHFDAAVISSPTEYHYSLAKTLLEADKHLLVEKPITPRRKEGLKLLQLAIQKKKIFLGGHVERYNPAVILLSKHLSELGAIYHLESERTGPFPERVLSVGVGVDLLVHDIDLMLMLMKSLPNWAFAHQERRVHPRCEDGITALLGFKGNVLAVLKANWLSPTKSRRFRVYGSKGMFEVDFLNRNLSFHENRMAAPIEDSFGLVGMEEGDQIKYKTLATEPLANELEYFINAIRNNRWDKNVTRCNLDAIGVVEKVMASAAKGKKVFFK